MAGGWSSPCCLAWWLWAPANEGKTDATVEEQQFWVARLLKKIQKSGYKATGQVYLTPLFNSELFFCSLDNKIKKP